MFEKLKKWLGLEDDYEDAPPPRASALNRSGAFARPAPGRPAPRRPAPPRRAATPGATADQPAGTQSEAGSEIEDLGPGKNVLVRNKYRREDTGTHEMFTIVDDSIVESGEESGIDPYNTGKFDRSRNWDKRFR